MSESDFEIPEPEHRPASRRWVAAVRGGEARLEYRELAGGRIDMYRTYVPPPARGRGVAGALVRRALSWARERGAEVVPTCSFVRRYLLEHPEETDSANGSCGGRTV